jgi:prolyl oligopeptidase
MPAPLFAYPDGDVMRSNLPIVLSLLSSACATVSPPPSENMMPLASAEPAVVVPQEPAITYPVTRRTDLVEPQFGVAVADPYRWLENDVRSDAEVRGWVEQQNKATNSFLATLPLRDRFKARMTEL